MPVSVTSAFSEPEDFEAALRKGGCLSLLITGRGRFRAQLTVVRLHRLRLSAAEERLSRIAFIAVPADMFMTAFSIGNGTQTVRGEVRMQPGEIMILPPGEHVHVRTDGPRRWGSVWIPVAELVRYGSALTGAPVALPPASQSWHPPPAAARHLRSLHAAAIRMAKNRPQVLVDREAAHGLEQQLIHAVVECLTKGAADQSARPTLRHQDIMARFERLFQVQPNRNMSIGEMCAALGVSPWLLRKLCGERLGMSPTGYCRLRRMSLVRCALRRGCDAAVSIPEVARRYGFRDLSRFVANYHAAFGELPSATLWQRLDQRMVAVSDP